MLFIVKSSTDFSVIFSPSFRGSPPSHVSAMEAKVTIGMTSASNMTYFFIRLLQKLIFCMVGRGAAKWGQLIYGDFHLPDSFYLKRGGPAYWSACGFGGMGSIQYTSSGASTGSISKFTTTGS